MLTCYRRWRLLMLVILDQEHALLTLDHIHEVLVLAPLLPLLLATRFCLKLQLLHIRWR